MYNVLIMRIHFICHGNAYRSRLAEGYFRTLNSSIEVISTGTLADLHRAHNDPNTLNFVDDFLKKQGIEAKLKPHPEQFTTAKLRPDDIVVCVTQGVADEVRQIAKPSNKIIAWDIDDFDDPHSNPAIAKLDADQYTAYIFERIKNNIDNLLAKME